MGYVDDRWNTDRIKITTAPFPKALARRRANQNRYVESVFPFQKNPYEYRICLAAAVSQV